jgi:drug/metabolite transporter (DMT)-like permease
LFLNLNSFIEQLDSSFRWNDREKRMKHNNTLIAVIIALLASVLWSGNFVLARGVNEWMQPIGFAFWRWVITFICLIPFALPHYKSNIALVKQNPKPYILMGVVGVAIFNTVIYKAAHFTSANNISLLAATSPIWTLFLAGVFKMEDLNRNKIIGLFVAFAGALTVILQGNYLAILHMDINNGDLMVIAASWCWATYSLALKSRHKEMNMFFLMIINVYFGLLVLTPFYIAELYFVGYTPFSMNALYVYLYAAIGSSVIAWYMFNKAVFMIGAVKTSLLYYTMPVFSGVLSVLFLDEHFYKYHVVGFLLVLGGIIVSNISPKSK